MYKRLNPESWATIGEKDLYLGVLCCFCSVGLVSGDRYHHNNAALCHARCKVAEEARIVAEAFEKLQQDRKEGG